MTKKEPQLAFPLVFWNACPPSHEVTALAASSDADIIISGAKSGELCVWRAMTDSQDGAAHLRPCIIMLPSTTKNCGAVSALSFCKAAHQESLACSPELVLSSHHDHYLRLWDPTDGRCIASSTSSLLPFAATHISTLHGGRVAVCSGPHPDILLVDLWTMGVLSVLRGSQDWVTSFSLCEVLVAQGNPSMGLMALSADGCLHCFKSKLLDSNSPSPKNWIGLLEGLDKSTGQEEVPILSPALTVRISSNISDAPLCMAVSPDFLTVLVVFFGEWIVIRRGWLYLSSDLRPKLGVSCPDNSGWQGGSFLSNNRVVAWTRGGRVEVYDLPDLNNAVQPNGNGEPVATVAAPGTPPKSQTSASEVGSTPRSDDGEGTPRKKSLRRRQTHSYHNLRAQITMPPCLLQVTIPSDAWSHELHYGAALISKNSYLIFGNRSGTVMRLKLSSKMFQIASLHSHSSSQELKEVDATSLQDAPLQQSTNTIAETSVSEDTDNLTVKTVDDAKLQQKTRQALKAATRVETGHMRTNWTKQHLPGPLFEDVSCSVIEPQSERAPLYVLGYADGRITVFQLPGYYPDNSAGFAPMSRSSGKILKPVQLRTDETHRTGISCLYLRNNLLLSGDQHGVVGLWDMGTPLRSDNLLAKITDIHTSPVMAFMDIQPFPGSQESQRQRRYIDTHVCSISGDGSLALFSLASKTLKHVFQGMQHGVTHLYVQPDAEYLLAKTNDGSLYIWQLSSGVMERKLYPSMARDMLSTLEVDLSIPITDSPHVVKAKSEPMLILESLNRAMESAVNHPEPGPSDPLTVRSVRIGGKTASIVQILVVEVSELSQRLKQQAQAQQLFIKSRSATWPLEVLSLLHAWGLNPELDELIRKDLNLQPAWPLPHFGVLGVGGAISLVLPTYPQHYPDVRGLSALRWQLSSHVTALYSLCIMSCLVSLTACGGDVQSVLSKLIAHYNGLFQESLSTVVQSSVSLLAQIGMTDDSDLYTASRMLLSHAIESIEPEQRKVKTRRWLRLLKYKAAVAVSTAPTLANSHSHSLSASNISAAASTVASVTSSNVTSLSKTTIPRVSSAPNVLHAPATGKAVTATGETLVLEGLLETQEVVVYVPVMTTLDCVTVLVLSLLALQFPEEVDSEFGSRVTEALLLMLSQTGEYSTTMVSTAAELLGRGFSVWRHYIPDLPSLLHKLLAVSITSTFSPSHAAASSGHAENKPKSIQPRDRIKHDPIRTACHRSLIEMGAVEPVMFINTMGHEALNTEHGFNYPPAALLMIVSLVKRHSSLLVTHLPAVVEAVLRCLDPSEPTLRKACLQASTAALHEMVKRFPMVSFHQQTQRFAVGTVESIIIIYDLRTATKWRILEGHSNSLSALSFSRTGDYLASYSSKDLTVRTWQAGSSGFFGGILGIQGRCLKLFQLQPLQVDAGSISASDFLQNVRLDWVDQKELRLMREDRSTWVLELK
eukprot:GILJ01008720.1.p1 GENE.GILJ01008720.1~~GILJ01008720.1.p1  ORF type:complete len:1456 (+),score=203.82 GILJ01008720.1:39-4406(+)